MTTPTYHWIKVPEPVQSKDNEGNPVGKPIGIPEIWDGTLCHDKRVSANYKSIRRANNVSEVLKNPISGKEFKWYKMADDEYDFLKPIAEEPQGLRQGAPNAMGQPTYENGYPSGAFVQIFPLLRAIMEAVSEEPEDITKHRS